MITPRSSCGVALAKRSGKHSFIETGTYKGETTLIALDYGFKFVRTCDLTFQNLSGETDKKIYSYTDRNVQTIIGDSPDVIPRVLKELKAYFPDPKDQEAVIYLDAHASGELAGGRSGGSPLLDEIYALMEDNIKTHTIFIGNRRLFGSSEWSFVSEESVLTALKVLNPNYKITTVDGYVQNDMIVASVYDNG